MAPPKPICVLGLQSEIMIDDGTLHVLAYHAVRFVTEAHLPPAAWVAMSSMYCAPCSLAELTSNVHLDKKNPSTANVAVGEVHFINPKGSANKHMLG